MISVFDPGHDRDSWLLTRGQATLVRDLLLQETEQLLIAAVPPPGPDRGSIETPPDPYGHLAADAGGAAAAILNQPS